MHITKYLNEIEEKGYGNNIIVKTLVEIIRAQKNLCDNFYFNPILRHAETVISEIANWEVGDANLVDPFACENMRLKEEIKLRTIDCDGLLHEINRLKDIIAREGGG